MYRSQLEKSRTVWLFVPVFLGVFIRWVFLQATIDLELWADEAKYVYLAVAWDRFGVYLGSTNWLWPPGYPAFLAIFLSRFGEAGLNTAKLFQVLMSGVIGASVVLLARQVFSRRAALVAGFLWALYLPLIAFTHLLWPETLLLTLLLPSIYLYLGVLASPEPARSSRFRLVATGLLLGLACLVKEIALAMPLLFALGILIERRQGSMSRRLAHSGILVLATVAVILPWSLRNAEVYGRWTLGGSTLGQNAWMGVNGVYRNFDYTFLAHQRYREDHPVYRWLIKAPAGSFWKRSNTANLIDRSTENAHSGLDFVRQHPGYYLRSRVKKLADWATPYSFFIRHFRLDLYPAPLSRGGVRHVLVAASFAGSVLVLLGAIPGLFWGISERTLRAPFILALVASLAPVWVTSMSRYRAPIEPLLLVLTAGFLTAAGRPWFRTSLGTGLVLCGWLLLAVLWLINSQELLWELKKIL